jgi:mono/diheme cytochrome c family protein
VQRRGYEVYARVCSRCHTLARSINAPYVSRGWWDFYITNMRMRSRRRGESLERRDAEAILDFLEYDSNERKVARAAEFDETRFELKRRFEAALDERVNDLKKQTEPPDKP